MNKEKILLQKEEQEFIIQELHKTSECLEKFKDKLSIGNAREKVESFIKDLDKELYWEEEYLQELDDSINFIYP